MKTCTTCGVTKPVDDFSVRRASADGRQSRCRECFGDYYRRNAERMIATAAQRVLRVQAENRRLLTEHLRANPCVDCGEDDLRVLDLDHRDEASKRTNVARMLASSSWALIEAEIAKCDVRCASCHRRRTAERADWWRDRVQREADEQRARRAADRVRSLGIRPTTSAAW